MTDKTLDIYKKLKTNNNYKLTEEEKKSIDLSNKSLSIDGKFKLYKQIYNKNYKSTSHENVAKIHFNKNVSSINNFNDTNQTYKLGITQFTDLSSDEFSEYIGVLIINEDPTSKEKSTTNIDDTLIKDDTSDVKDFLIDYEEKGGMPPVQDQKKCGGCWAFGTIAAFEGTIAKKYNLKGKDIPKYSEQYLISCDNKTDNKFGKANQGCGGGDPRIACEFLLNNNAILLKDYEYNPPSAQGLPAPKCDSSKKANKKAIIKKYTALSQSPLKTANDYEIAKALFNNGPMVIAIGALETGIQFANYHSGIYTGPCSPRPNHAVTLVGLVEANKVPGFDASKNKDIKYAWKIRNSWGTVWGNKGHFYYPYNKKQCFFNYLPVSIDDVDVEGLDSKPTPGPSPSPSPDSTPSPTSKPDSTPTPTSKPDSTPSPSPGPSPKPTPPSRKPTPPSRKPTRKPTPGPTVIKDFKKYYSNPNKGSGCIRHKLTFDDGTSVCSVEAGPIPNASGLASDIQLFEYCPGNNEKKNIKPLFFVQDSIAKKYCGVACNTSKDCLHQDAVCKSIMHNQSPIKVCVFNK